MLLFHNSGIKIVVQGAKFLNLLKFKLSLEVLKFSFKSECNPCSDLDLLTFSHVAFTKTFYWSNS